MGGDKNQSGKGKKTIVGGETPRRRRDPASPINPVSDVYRPLFDYTQCSPEATRHALSTFPSPNMTPQPTSPLIPFEMLQIGMIPQYTPSPLTRQFQQIHTSNSQSSQSSTQFSTSVSLDWTPGSFQNLLAAGGVPNTTPGLEDVNIGVTHDPAVDSDDLEAGAAAGGERAVNSPSHGGRHGGRRGGRRGSRGGRRPGGARWGWIEDEILLNSWLHVSNDATIGVDQSGDCFWEKVCYTCRQSSRAEFFQERSKLAIKKHFNDIHTKVKQFAGYYARIERNAQSGTNENDWLKEAIGEFAAYVGPWHMHNHWSLLRHHPAWFIYARKTREVAYALRKPSKSGSASSEKRSRSGESDDEEDEEDVPPVPHFPVRPPGRDATKKAKAAESSGVKGKGKAKAIDDQIEKANREHKTRGIDIQKIELGKNLRAERKRRETLFKAYSVVKLMDKAAYTPQQAAADDFYLAETMREIEESRKLSENMELELATLNSVEHLISSDSDD